MKVSFETPELRAIRYADQRLMRLGGFDFHRMKEYMNSMRDNLRYQSDRITEFHKESLKKTPQQWQMIDEYFDRQLDDSENNFVGLLFNSSMAVSASIFEVMFKKVCHYAAYKTHTKFEEPLQQVTLRCKQFIERLIDLSEVEEHWEIIQTGLLVRNRILHNGATYPYEKNVFEPKMKALILHIKTNEFIEVKKPRSKQAKRFVIIDRLYIFNFLDWCRDYLIWIIMHLPERRGKKSKKKSKAK